MIKNVDLLLQFWGSELKNGKLEASIPSMLGSLAEDLATTGVRSSSSKDLSLVPAHLKLSRLADDVDCALLMMFNDKDRGGLGNTGRAGSLWRLARVRYVRCVGVPINEQLLVLGISNGTYKRWLSDLHEFIAGVFPEYVDAA
ncbi:hypothetical protein VQ643_09565 [Pseudomonas sp. F1_0610]|uniref:hypothetical protein n=1 Tax=Pseudomonas sp. F1_0610 TaxID=3114284 RepID=UPI0039C37152